MIRLARCFSTLLALIATTLPWQAMAQEGLIDPSFGPSGNGWATIDGPQSNGATSLLSVLVKPTSGRILYVARRPGTGAVAVGALTRDGLIDPGFNNGQLLTIGTSAVLYTPRLAAHVTEDLTLLSVTEYIGGAYVPVVCQIRADGTLDPAFTSGQYPGQAGCIRLNVPESVAPSGMVLAGIAPGESGTILRFGGTGYDFGSPSNTVFPVTGLLITHTSENPSSAFTREFANANFVYINAFTLFRLDNGGMNLYLAGGRVQNDDTDVYVARRFVGQTSFYNDAWFPVNLVPKGMDNALAITTDWIGRPLLAIDVDKGNGLSTCMVMRLTAVVNQDNTFGPSNNGRRFIDYGAGPTTNARCDAIAAHGSNQSHRILAAGTVHSEMAVARLDVDGAPDASFGNAGVVLLASAQQGTRHERVWALGVQGTKPILAGTSEPITGATPMNTAMAFARLTFETDVFADGFE